MQDEYETFEDALENIWHFIEEVYNKKRLHSALDLRSSDQFESEVALSPHSAVNSCKLKFMKITYCILIRIIKISFVNISAHILVIRNGCNKIIIRIA